MNKIRFQVPGSRFFTLGLNLNNRPDGSGWKEIAQESTTLRGLNIKWTQGSTLSDGMLKIRGGTFFSSGLFLTLSDLPDTYRSRHYRKTCQRPKVLTAFLERTKNFIKLNFLTSNLSGLGSLLLNNRNDLPSERLFKLSPFRTFTRIPFLLISLFLFLMASTVNAQDSLSVYLQLAAKNNPGVKAAFNQYLAALEKVPQVGSLPDPQGAMEFFLKPMELLNGNQVGSISVMQMFPWFGTLKLAKDEASLMARAQFELFQESKAGLFYNVKASWYQLARYKRGITLINQNIALLESLEKLTLVKFQSPAGSRPDSGSGSSSGSGMQGTPSASGNGGGMGGMNNQPAASGQQQTGSNMSSGTSGGMDSKPTGLADVLRVRMEILDQKNQLLLLKDQLKTEEANFNSLLSRDQNIEIDVPDSLKMETLSVSALAVADSILGNNPMLAMFDAEGQSYSAMADKARKMGLPMLGVGLNYMVIQQQAGNQSMMNGKDMVMPMLNFTIPIYRKKYTAMQKEARFLQESTIQKSDEMKNMLLVQHRQLVQNYSDAERRVELYREQADLANRTANLLLAGFTSTGTDFEEILRIQYKVLEYGLKHIEAVADYNTAVAKAEKLMNTVNY